MSGASVDPAASSVDEEWRLRRLFEARNRVLEGLATGAPRDRILRWLAEDGERLVPGVLCSILLLEPATHRLRHGIAPSLPPSFWAALDGLLIGPTVGSCGAAAFRRELVIVDDILTHPNWAPYLPIAAEGGVRACWSQPILSTTAEVLGTFAMYYREPRRPEERDLEFIRTFAQMASLAIQRARMDAELERHRQGLEEEVRRRTAQLEQTNRQLREALNDVRTLRGLLPICLSCKRARDGEGYWEQIESYLRARSDAVIAQGICPECREKIFSSP